MFTSTIKYNFKNSRGETLLYILVFLHAIFFLSYSSSKIPSSFPSYLEHFSPTLFLGKWGKGIPVTNFLSCFTSENVLVLPLLLKDIFWA